MLGFGGWNEGDGVFGLFMMGAMLLAPSPASAPHCPVTNLMPDYWALQARGAPFEDYRTALMAKHPTLYTANFVNALQGKQFAPWERDEQVFASKQLFASQAISRILVGEVPHYVADFTRTFPALKCSFKIYIAPSFGTMNAAAAQTPDGLKIVVSPVTILQNDGDRISQFKLLFDHELFHIYHAQASGGAFGASQGNHAPLYASLWSEGLAVYASERQNLGIGRDRSLLDLKLETSARPLRQDIARAILADLNNREPGVFERYFSGSAKNGAFPARSGYYVGALVADDLARTHTMQQLAALNDREAHTLIRRSLETIVANGR